MDLITCCLFFTYITLYYPCIPSKLGLSDD